MSITSPEGGTTIKQQKYNKNIFRSYNLQHLYEVFLDMFYEIVFNRPCPRFSKEALQVIEPIDNYYLDPHDNYIHIYECTLTPHILPK